MMLRCKLFGHKLSPVEFRDHRDLVRVQRCQRQWCLHEEGHERSPGPLLEFPCEVCGEPAVSWWDSVIRSMQPSPCTDGTTWSNDIIPGIILAPRIDYICQDMIYYCDAHEATVSELHVQRFHPTVTA